MKLSGAFFKIIIFWSMCSCPVYAQFSFGPATGVHFIPLSNTAETGQSYGMGWHGGIFFSHPLSSRFSISPELRFITRKKLYNRTVVTPLDENELFNLLTGGGSLDTLGIDISSLLGPVNSDIITKTNGSVRLSFAELALPVDINLTKSLYVKIGPYVDMLASARSIETVSQDIPMLSVINQDSIPAEIKFFLKIFYPQYYNPETNESSSKKNLTQLDVGFLTGIGCRLSGNFLIEMRYTRGFFDYRSKIEDGEDSGLSIHQGLEFHLAYSISSELLQKRHASAPRFPASPKE